MPFSSNLFSWRKFLFAFDGEKKFSSLVVDPFSLNRDSIRYTIHNLFIKISVFPLIRPSWSIIRCTSCSYLVNSRPILDHIEFILGNGILPKIHYSSFIHSSFSSFA